jgi:glycogen phosphorylase
LATHIGEQYGITVNPQSLFDIQAKRIHEYKRQHLNVLYIITLYNRIKANPDIDITPQTFLFAGKAAPGYFMAKLMIKLINSVADVVNRDPDVRDRLKVVFLKDYSVKFAQNVYPAADLSEQISTAGKEASGTGNMKFAMNGALTIGTLDGANIEIREEVGAENFFLFGLTEQEVQQMSAAGYSPMDYYHTNMELKLAIDRISSGFFSHGDTELFKPLLDILMKYDPYFLFADYQSYIDCQHQASQAFRDREHWTRMSILNVARMGKFSSDRSIREYCQDIWKIEPVNVELKTLMF